MMKTNSLFKRLFSVLAGLALGATMLSAQNTITVIPAIRFLYEKNIIYEASAEFNYTVIPLDSVMEIDRNNMKLNMKTDVIPGFLSAAYSSLRGIVYARTRATPLEKYPIPLIDTEKLLSKNGFSISE